jgi:hypothetical protein
VQARLQRWENALESGDLSIEHAAQRIKQLHEQRQELLKKKQALDRDRPSMKKVSAIPTAHMAAYIAEMRLTYKLPLAAAECRFFTPLRLVGPPGLEPARQKNCW